MAVLEIAICPIIPLDDFPQLVAIEQAAFAGSKMLTMLFGARSAESDTVLAARYQHPWSIDPTSHYLKATNLSGEMIGIAIWNI
jgi:hypothetical protein